MTVKFACRRPRRGALLIFTLALCLAEPSRLFAQDAAEPASPLPSLQELFYAGGYIGVVILALSVAMLALIIEHLITIRRAALIPSGLAEHAHQLILQGQYAEAERQCRQQASFLSRVLQAGLSEVTMGYSAVEKAMEDAATEQTARLFRKIEYLSLIGTLAPMLGLLGTVWGMITAFRTFELKPNPQVAELAPGIYEALVTTLLGLFVAVPALAAFAIFRNRIEGLAAEASLMAERVFVDYKRTTAARRQAARPPTGKEARAKDAASRKQSPGSSIPPVVPERRSG